MPTTLFYNSRPAATGKKDIGFIYRFVRPTYRGETRRFPWGERPTYRGPRDQLTVDNFPGPTTYPQAVASPERDRLTAARARLLTGCPEGDWPLSLPSENGGPPRLGATNLPWLAG